MDRDRFQKAMSIFDRARTLRDGDRTAYLNEACAADVSLRDEVEELLRHDERPAGLFQSSSDEGGGAAILADSIRRMDSSGTMPKQIGRYSVTRLIGEGGMGTVYEAQQEHPRRTVAVKVLRGGIASPGTLRRFGYEAQVLGRLQHPGIAQIIEAGVAETGLGEQPFLVMELIAGQRLDVYARSALPVLRDRLLLFLRICDAVQHAHQKGVIHRDLKPANILVVQSDIPTRGVSSDSSRTNSRDAAVGQPKVLDFGLAKLVEPDVTLTAMATETGRVQGTLAYMSPEQARGNTDEIDVRSDVYSLGVILYELLTDQLPYDVSRMTLPEAVRVICDQPPRPPGSISRSLRGDLETIVFKALEKEPQRRYAGVASLAEDVERYLSSQPILARRPSAAYQLRKLISRHKAPFAFAASLFLLVSAFGVWMSLLYTRAEANRVRAVRAEETSSLEAQTARQATAFLINLFKVSDPSETRGNTITAREVLDRGAGRVRSELKSQPLVQASLMDAIGQVYLNLGLHQEATPFIEDALKLRQTHLGPDSIEYADSLESLAVLKDETGNTAEPEGLLRKALEIRLRHESAMSPAVAELQNNLASALYRKDKLGEAETLYRQSLAARLELFGEKHVDVAESLVNLALLQRDRGTNKEAEDNLRKALAIQLKLLPPDHPYLAISNRALAEVLQRSGELDEALTFFVRSLEIERKVHGPDHPRVGLAVEGLAKIMFLRGNLVAAEEYYRDALRIQLLTLSEEHGEVVHTINNLGVVLYRRGKSQEAAQMWERALELTIKRVGDSHTDVAMALNNLAIIHWEQEEWDKAVSEFERSLAIKQKNIGRENADVALTMDNLGAVWRDRRDFAKAEPLLIEALAMRKKVLGAQHPDVGQSLNNIGELQFLKGDLAGAEASLSEARAILAKKLGAQHPNVAYPIVQLGRIKLEQKDAQGAEALFREAIALRSAEQAGESAELALCKSWLGAALAAQQRFDEAEPLLTESYFAMQKAKGVEHSETKLARERVRTMYVAWGKPDRAAEFAASSPVSGS